MISQSTLTHYDKKMKWTDDLQLPAMQGAWIQQLINEFKVNPTMWGYDGTRIGLKDKFGTKVFFKCDGVTLTPLGKILGDKAKRRDKHIKKAGVSNT